MALLTLDERKAIFKELGLGEYNETNIKAFQKKYLLRKKDYDGVYGQNTDNALRTVYYTKIYTKNFDAKEFRCECGGKYCSGYPDYMKPAELIHIQKIRDHYGKPITITCGLRDKKYNASLGGSVQNSLHLKGQALDFYQEGVTNTLANRKASIKWIKKQANHHYTYGNGINSNGYSVRAPYMGNALHTDTYDNVVPKHPGGSDPTPTPKPTPTPTPTPSGKLTVDGIGGKATVKAMQKYFGCTVDGVISGQLKSASKYYPALESVKFGKGGSPCIRKLQKWCGATQDGILGEKTVKKWQKKLGVKADGIFGKSSMKAWQKFLNGTITQEPQKKPSTDVQTPSDTTSDKPPYKFIDVSVWQGDIDWAKVKADGVVGAIIRYADGASVDTKFEKNMTEAKANGLHIGAYIYSRAKTKTQAQTEATRIFEACKKFDPDMPLYIDLEASSLSKYADTVAVAYLNKIKSLGGKGGVYANLNWWNNYLTKTAKNYSSNPFWIAQYNDKITHKNPKLFGMWQYSSSGKVKGISGRVDMDWCYTAYWEKPKDDEPKPETPKPEAPKEEVEVTPDWVKRANAWAEALADDPKAGYRTWSAKDKSTHECLLCHPESDPKHKWYPKTWNCVGESLAYWHHGGGLPCTCSCYGLANPSAAKLLTMSDKEALAYVRKKLGLQDLKVIRNNGKAVPNSKKKAGDLCMVFDKNGKYVHIYPYVGNGYMIDCGHWKDKKRQIAKRKATPSQVVIRYTGK